MITLIEEEDVDALLAAIEQDSYVSELLIQVAKSAVYGVMPNTVKQAAIYMGLPNLKCFLYFACVASAAKQNGTFSKKSELLMKHSFLTNRIFLFLFEAFLHKQPQESAMFAGLLHNIGLILLTNSLQNNEKEVQPPLTTDARINQDESVTQFTYQELEPAKLEEAHQEIGAHFIDQWDLPFSMYEAALYHHRPLSTNIINQELVSCVHIAQAYAWKTLGVSVDLPPVSPEVFDHIGCSATEFEKRLARYLK
jgi:HD-like signal output (HDOD) protein